MDEYRCGAGSIKSWCLYEYGSDWWDRLGGGSSPRDVFEPNLASFETIELGFFVFLDLWPLSDEFELRELDIDERV